VGDGLNLFEMPDPLLLLFLLAPPFAIVVGGIEPAVDVAAVSAVAAVAAVAAVHLLSMLIKTRL
jgi:hypothetical protein